MLSVRAGTPPPRAHSSALAQLHAALAKSGLSTCSATPASAAAAARACSRLRHLRAGRAVHGASTKLALLSASTHSTLLPNALLHLYASSPGGHLRLARLLFDTMPAKDAASYNILLTALASRGHVAEALELFDEIPEPNVRSWTALIAGFAQSGRPADALRIFRDMENAGVSPNEVTVVATLAACADVGDLDLGRQVHIYAKQQAYCHNVQVGNTAIDMYVKCGCVDVARAVFDAMDRRTVVSWSAMICGHAMHGEGENALELFAAMSRQGVLPNGVTFVGLLHACSHMGLVDEGLAFFESMEKDHDITPGIEHYGCVVDLLSRSGRLDEALEFINAMPVEPNSVVWGALLGGARLHKNVEMGEEAIRHLTVLDPGNDGYYVVLSNIYADAGRWEDVARVRRAMKHRGVKKTKGWSTISVGGTVLEFTAGDCSHPRATDICETLDKLLSEARRRGYVPDTSVVLLDVDDNEKERVLARHSEKLAVAFGLMTTPPGTTLRVMKNLRVCSDCHAALKLISEIAGREIVVRDRNRFHCFRSGACSCRDYW
ncbi:pentatricopeptide repeat-containing protein At5g66520-like [Phragmites australis]|uniref:pentatricopeptide repeat-containing protein At5g66520-like n=1 Tax=Phragmites australis TaxID=29695 RepID=UPI002D797E8F|nr:pentatricopeptide repeat-containing protein At5g66520-like [Phragmites australis]